MSKLIVEVCEITDIKVHPNADKLEIAVVKGWETVVSKGLYKIGQPVVYFPPDCVLPRTMIEEQKLTFLKDSGRLKTIKLRGVISQGMILGLECLKGHTVRVGDDVAKILGVTKYEVTAKPISVPRETISSLFKRLINHDITLRRFVAKSVAIIYDRYFKAKKNANSEFKKYTDIQNIKHYPNEFIEGEQVIISEKTHGSNGRWSKSPIQQTFWTKLFGKTTHEWCYGSHNIQKTVLSGNGWYGEDVWGQIAKKYNLKDILPNGYQLFGEVYGGNPKIQNLTYDKPDSLDVVFFDLMIDGKYVDFKIFKDFCLKNNLPIVPILYIGPFSKEVLQKYTEGLTNLGKGVHITEGCIVKPIVESYSNHCGRKVLKSINPEYLLTKDEDNEHFAH